MGACCIKSDPTPMAYDKNGKQPKSLRSELINVEDFIIK